jgi:hypothetical protein
MLVMKIRLWLEWWEVLALDLPSSSNVTRVPRACHRGSEAYPESTGRIDRRYLFGQMSIRMLFTRSESCRLLESRSIVSMVTSCVYQACTTVMQVNTLKGSK